MASDDAAVSAGRGRTVVPGGGRHAAVDACAFGEAALRPLALLCRTRGDCAHALAGRRRNAATRSDGLQYRATTVQWRADRSARRTKPPKFATNPAMRAFVEERLAGMVVVPGGAKISGPAVAWKGRRHGRWQARRWASAWSPSRSPVVCRSTTQMTRRCASARGHLLGAVFARPRCASSRAHRLPAHRAGTAGVRVRSRGRGKSFVAPEILTCERPAEADDRAVPGQWESDLILGLGSSAIGTLVERATRFTLLHLPRMPRHGKTRPSRTGPRSPVMAPAVQEAITRTITTLREQLRRSLTCDQGGEDEAARATADRGGMPIYFCDPRSPWQRRTNENTSGLLRQYFPQGCRSQHPQRRHARGGRRRPQRQTPQNAWLETPAEALDRILHSSQTDCVATTG